MDEFNNRMDVQRKVLALVNNSKSPKEELCGLSCKAIERWANLNNVPVDSKVFWLMKKISKKLFFLASKSQEQVSEEYQFLSSEIGNLITDLEKELGQIG